MFINRELISRGEAALFYDPQEPWNEAKRTKVWNSIQRVYDLFLERVADSRQMGAEAVDAVGGGRVWTGRQALENGLVDEIGGLDQAVEKARELGELRGDAAVRVYYAEKEPILPVAEPAAMIKYVFEGFKLQEGRVLCLLPWVKTQ